MSAWRLLLLAPLLVTSGCGLGALIGGSIAASGGSSSSAGVAPAPLVLAIVPSSGTHDGGYTVVITGEHFPTDPTNPPTVSIGGQQAIVTVDSSTQLTVSVPYSGVVGAVAVSVTHPQTGTGTLASGFTYTNTLPTANVAALSSPQSQNIVFTVILQDAEADSIDLALEVQVNAGPWTTIPSNQILSGGLTGLSSTPGGKSHNLTWDSRVMYPASNAVNVVLRVTPTDTVDGQIGTLGASNAFQILNNTPVAVSIVQPGDDEFDVAVSFIVSDPDGADPVVVTALTYTELNTVNTGAMTISAGQGLGAIPFSASGTTATGVWDSLTDLGLGNSHLVQLTVTVSDGTTSASATSLPFFVNSGPLSNATSAPAGQVSAGFAVCSIAGDGRRKLLHGAVAAGPFLGEEMITGGASGSTAMVRKVGSDYLLVDSESAPFVLGETVTGGTSGAGATLDSLSTFPARRDVVAFNPGAIGSRGSISEIEGLGKAFQGPRVTVAPDVPGPAVPGSPTNPFQSGFAHPCEGAILDLGGDGLQDLVSADALQLGVPTLLGHAGADAPALFANVIAHQVLLECTQVAGALRVSSGTYTTAQANRADVATHVRVVGQSVSAYPPVATGNPSLDLVGWFVRDLVDAELDTPGSPGDGKEDLVVVHQVRQLGSALVGDAQSALVVRQVDPATLALGPTYYLDPTDMGIAATQAAVGDITADAHTLANGGLPGDGRDVPVGTPDIIVANLGDSSLTFYLQIGAAVAPAPPTYASCRLPMTDLNPLIPVGDTISVAIGDLNGDSKNDFIVVGQLSQVVYIFIHDPDPAAPGSLLPIPSTFGLLPFRLAGALPLPALAVDARATIADVSGDGRADIVVPMRLTNELILFANQGNVPTPPSTTPTPIFGPPPTFAPDPVRFTTQFGPLEVVAADVNSDGRKDIVALTFAATFAVHYQVTPGTLDLLAPVPTGIGPLTVESADLTGDGIPEVVTSNNGSNTVQIFQRDPVTALSLLQTFDLGVYQDPSPPIYAPSLPYYARVTDVTGEGDPDILVSMGFVLGPGSSAGGWELIGGSPLSPTPTLVAPSGIVGFGVDAGDFLFAGGVPDGLPDVALGSFTGGLVLQQNLGGGAFGPPVVHATGAIPLVEVTDVDGDGYQDVIGVANTLGKVYIFYNGGDPAGSIPYGTLPATPVAVDGLGIGAVTIIHAVPLLGTMNGPNPLQDLVFGDFTSSQAGILFQTAPRVFSGVLIPSGDEAGEISSGDLNQDGLLDIVIPWGGEDVLAVYYQNPAPTGLADTFFGPATFATANVPVGSTVVDVDGDGLNDVVVSCRGSDVLEIFKQR